MDLPLEWTPEDRMTPDVRDTVTLGTLTWGGLLVGGPVGALVGWALGHSAVGAALGALAGVTLGGFYASDLVASGDAPLFPSRNT